MATRAQLDAALEQERQDIKDAAERHEQQLKDVAAKQKEALDALQAKLDAQEDFSAELATLNETHNQLTQLAAAPITAPGDVTGQGAGSTGAAGTTTVGADEHAAIEAAGGQVDTENNPMAGSATIPQITPQPEPPAETQQPPAEGEQPPEGTS